jgi:hypothetical protein
VDSLPAVPLLGIHPLKESLAEGRLQTPAPKALLRDATHVTSSSWLIAGASYGSLLALSDNTIVLGLALLATRLSPMSLPGQHWDRQASAGSRQRPSAQSACR